MAENIGMYMTRQIVEDAAENAKFHGELISCAMRFLGKDWGELCEDDKALNNEAIEFGGRILAAYETTRGKIYIITDDTKAVPRVTTVLYASEY